MNSVHCNISCYAVWVVSFPVDQRTQWYACKNHMILLSSFMQVASFTWTQTYPERRWLGESHLQSIIKCFTFFIFFFVIFIGSPESVKQNKSSKLNNGSKLLLVKDFRRVLGFSNKNFQCRNAKM